MSVTIIIPTPLRQYAGGCTQAEFEAKAVGEALDNLTTRYTELRKHLYNEQNALRSFVNVYVNDEDIRHGLGLETPVKDGDTVMIVPSIAGGVNTIETTGPAFPLVYLQGDTNLPTSVLVQFRSKRCETTLRSSLRLRRPM